MIRILSWACTLLLLAGLAWGGGFAVFDMAARRRSKAAPDADGIVALTGGAERVDRALALLSEGRAPLLLISGVGRGADLGELEHRVRLSAEQASRVTLGRVATSTVGNAEETAGWARAHGVQRLIVVTAGYHMPRALLEIGRALPGVALYPVAVQPPALRGGTEMATMRMLANEYDKYLAVLMHMTRKAEGS